MDIKVCKLISGEYVISNVSDKEEYWEFESPVTAQLVPMGQGNVSVVLTPFDSFDRASDSVLIQKKHVMYWVKTPDQALINKYIESTSGITPASSVPPPAPTTGKPGIRMIK